MSVTQRLLTFGAVAAIGVASSMSTGMSARVPAVDVSPSVLAMDVHADGDVVNLLLFEETNGEKELRHRRSVDGAKTWGAPTRIDRGSRGIVAHHRGMDPQVAAAGDRIVVLWTMPGTSPWGEGALATALSSDGGRTWRAGPSPSDDASGRGHAFLDLTADPAGLFHAVWLDGRDGAQGLRGASSRDGGARWAPTVSIDTRTCECCWNKTLSTGPGSVAVLYRDKDPRDMALAASDDGGATWRRKGPVGAFNWGFDGCPHVGGGLAQTTAAGRSYLHAVVWTGAEQAAGVHVLRSDDGGSSWSAPRRLGAPTAKHTDLAASGAAAAAVWDERRSGEGVIMGSVSRDHGSTWSQARPLSQSGRTATHPLVVATKRGFVAFWTERPTGAEGPLQWRSAALAAEVPTR